MPGFDILVAGQVEEERPDARGDVGDLADLLGCRLIGVMSFVAERFEHPQTCPAVAFARMGIAELQPSKHDASFPKKGNGQEPT
ncbi:hypothetical protein [Aureimonas psammosilenae]|uniref:hypothetical protein n=1 Tax=Aureimonas psammosilenae TaxID=2495496 RepID=UPI00126100DA|nr:hypothetical protein [Aureimonas psammosilenae]